MHFWLTCKFNVNSTMYRITSLWYINGIFFLFNFLTISQLSIFNWNALHRQKAVRTSAEAAAYLWLLKMYQASTAEKSDFLLLWFTIKGKWTIDEAYYSFVFPRSNISDLLFIILMSPSFKDYLILPLLNK